MIRVLDVPTRVPLSVLIEPMNRWIEATRQGRDYNESLIDIYKGDIARYVDEKLEQINGKDASTISKAIKVVVNPMKTIIDKESKVYTDGVVRTTMNEINQEILDYYVRTMDVDSVFQDVNEYYNLNKYCAVEPYIMDGVPGLRVLTSTECIPFSDNQQNPSIPTVIIKPMGVAYEYRGQDYTNRGNTQTRTVKIYWAYSTTEIIIFDNEGKYRDDLMLENGLLVPGEDEEGNIRFEVLGNQFGIIPYLFVNESNKDLIPQPDSDLLPMALDASIQYTNLNYGLLYQSNSMLVAMDVDTASLQGAEISPRQILDLQSVESSRDGAPSGRLDVVTPEVNIDGFLRSIESKWQFFLTTRGFNTSNVSGRGGREFTGALDRLIGEADATSLYRQQITTFKGVERIFWQVMAVIHNTWVTNGMMNEERRGLTDDIQVTTVFTVAQPNYDEETLLDILEKQLSLGLNSKMNALRRVHPDLNEEELMALMDDIRAERVDGMMDGSMDMLQTAIDMRRPVLVREDEIEEAEQDG